LSLVPTHLALLGHLLVGVLLHVAPLIPSHLPMLKKYHKGVTRVLQGGYKGVTRVLQMCCKGVTRVLQGSYKGLTRVCVPSHLIVPVVRGSPALGVITYIQKGQ
jgi:hypothetical protein